MHGLRSWLVALLAIAAATDASVHASPFNRRRLVSTSAALQRKAELCAKDLNGFAPSLRLVNVTPEVRPSTRREHYPRVLCFVNTISTHLVSRAQAIADTWAQRCDKMLFFSNASDVLYAHKGTTRERRFEVVKLQANAAYNFLWDKHKASLRYVYEHYRHDYDWFYKADDDAYVILENLRSYLSRPEIIMNHKRQPMQLGHRFNLTESAANYYIRNDDVREKFWKRFDRWVFNSGGPGYVMNRLYLDKFLEVTPERLCMSDDKSKGVVADDAAISFCMMWYDAFPWDTRDHRGRERWHAFDPFDTYNVNDQNVQEWWLKYHQNIGGYKMADECCAPDSIGYHYMRAETVYHVERQFYFCRTGDDVPDLATFNDKYNLALGDKVVVHPSET